MAEITATIEIGGARVLAGVPRTDTEMTERKNKLVKFGVPNNFLTDTDSYKLVHWVMYPEDTKTVYSYFESRGGPFNKTLFFGLQTFLRQIEGTVVTKDMIDDMEEITNLHMGRKGLFNKVGWEYIVEKHGGRLPVSIKAVPEGTILKPHNVLITIENTDPKCFWLTNYLETAIVRMWYPMTVGTISLGIKAVIFKFLEETGDPKLLPFKLHDFGSRGVSSRESAAIGGAAHLVNFLGTDTVDALRLHREVYGEEMAGFSIPATEHAIMTADGIEGERLAMKRILDKFSTGLIACVSDSYDLFYAIEHILGEELREQIMKRDGTLVVRPDSGYPPEIVLKTVELLGHKFGCTTNEKGYRVLDPHVRVIQGDGINHEMILKILQTLKDAGWSADNIAFGMGGALLQKGHRDTLEMALKCSARDTLDGRTIEVFKQPKTDSKKNSKRGRLKLILRDGEYETVPLREEGEDQLVEVFRDGNILKEYSLAEIRERAEKSFFEHMRRGERIKRVEAET